LISVSVEGARSALPPIISGTCAAAHWMMSCDALRVAIMPESGPLVGTSSSQPSGSLRASWRSNWSASSGCSAR
jgi:hypothetical protein